MTRCRLKVNISIYRKLGCKNDAMFLLTDVLKKFVTLPPKDSLGFDKIFMINLKRRPERRQRMMNCFNELGLQVEVLDAVDGR